MARKMEEPIFMGCNDRSKIRASFKILVAFVETPNGTGVMTYYDRPMVFYHEELGKMKSFINENINDMPGPITIFEMESTKTIYRVEPKDKEVEK